MDAVKIRDKMFRISIPESEIKQRVKALAERINQDLAGKNPLLLAVLNGAYVFAADLMREITIPCEISFVKLASYQGTVSTGKITEVLGINEDLTDRVVVIVEDIVDTGLTMKRIQVPLDIEYVAMEIPNEFIVGYGLDYDQQGRNLKDIYTVVDK